MQHKYATTDTKTQDVGEVYHGNSLQEWICITARMEDSAQTSLSSTLYHA